ncbi:hypothetical protein FACS1894125_5570 [Actinomycetota bacterium]|nr:hypothetical protein FACS1894125_5570 [Actinomycetota bacterium]
MILIPKVFGIELDNISGSYDKAKLALVLLSFIFATLSYYFIENNTKKVTKLTTIIVLLVLAVLVIIIPAQMLKNNAQRTVDLTLEALHARANDDMDICFGARAIDNQDTCGYPYGVGDPYYLQFMKSDFELGFTMKCDTFVLDLEEAGCVVGDKSSSKTALLWGDSHAISWSGALDAAGKQLGIKVILGTFSSCQAEAAELDDLSITQFNTVEYNEHCLTKNRTIYDKYAKTSDIVILASARYYGGASFHSYPKLVELINNLSSAGRQVIVMQDMPPVIYTNPSNSSDVDECFYHSDRCTTNGHGTDNFVNRLKNDTQNMNVIYTRDRFCDGDFCPLIIGNVPYSRNNGHFDATYSRTLGPWLAKQLASYIF